ncbi:hypothetical protein Hsw_0434 [Hymenobacter swuensis DY53]|uniref:Uncharacterized protein n=2 Tax=Hymenobacter TaxID=89966 RepID=W8ESA9_9BACT|nr:hypothetical protein Hsw_0434 [Hymenobacter swuensis DY53]
MVFLLLALLVLLLPSVRSSFTSMAGSAESLFFGLLVAAVILLGLQLITENLDSTLLRRDVAARDGKINELKARLYDHQLDQQRNTTGPMGAPRTGTTTLPEGYVAPTPTIPPTDAANQPLA